MHVPAVSGLLGAIGLTDQQRLVYSSHSSRIYLATYGSQIGKMFGAGDAEYLPVEEPKSARYLR